MPHVYVIERDESLVKIGLSADPSVRVARLSAQGGFTPSRVWISLPTPDAKWFERAAHQDFAGYRGVGEWFSAGFDDVVDRLCSRLAEGVVVALPVPKKDLADYDMETVTGRVGCAMFARGVKQADLARACGISESAVSQWFGRNGSPKLEHLYPLADYLRVCPRWLATGSSADSADHLLTPLTHSQRAQALRMLEAYVKSCTSTN